MSKVITNGDFLRQKVNNFIAYSHKILKEYNIENEEINKHLNELQNADINWVTTFIISDIVPYHRNKRDYIKSMFKKSNISMDSIKEEHLVTFDRYIECFIDTISS